MHKILVIRLHFLFDALHVSDCVSPSSGATFISCNVAIATQQLIKVAPDDRLI